MRADIVPGAVFPTTSFLPPQHEGLQLLREAQVGYCRLVTISTDNLLETNEFRAGVGALWPSLSDPGRKLQKEKAEKRRRRC